VSWARKKTGTARKKAASKALRMAATVVQTARLVEFQPVAERTVRMPCVERLSRDGEASSYKRAFRSRNALPITDTELRLIAAAATMGESRRPKTGYRTPAASGTPSAL